MDIISIDSRQVWIPLSACKDGWAYYIHARNAKVGIFDKAEDGFVISRFKFNNNFLFTEYHWDTGEPYGTVKPLRELYPAPILPPDELLSWLNLLDVTIKADPWYIL